MSETTALIQMFYPFAERVAETLNTEIVATLGNDGDWQHWAGRGDLPEMFQKNFSPERLARLSTIWTLREEASGFSCDLSESDTETKEVAIADIEQLLEKLRLSEQENRELVKESINTQNAIVNLQGILAKSEKESSERFAKLKTIAVSGIEAAKLILDVITKSQTSHWQKKENLRNAIAVLESLQTRIAKADPNPLPFDDDF